MRYTIASNGVGYFFSDLIPCPHGFSTRIGGVSTLPHTATLNLGVERGDPLPVVLENLRRFGDAVRISSDQIVSVPQIHSATLRYVTADNGGEGFTRTAQMSCDGYYTDQRCVGLGVRTADCVPILFYGSTADGDARIAAVHAGWRGTVKGIAVRAIQALLSMSVERETIAVAIGPSIGPCCYEVGADFYQTVWEECGDDIANKCCVPLDAQHWRADLRLMNVRLLHREGLQAHQIDLATQCTCCDPVHFFSHRYCQRQNGLRGTMLSVIALP